MNPLSRVPSGSCWYVGATQVGKTTLALRHHSELVAKTGWPSIILDCGHATQFKDVYHEVSLVDVKNALWKTGDNVVWTPRHLREVDKFYEMVGAAGNVCVLMDEAHYYLNRVDCSEELLKVMRKHAHCSAYLQLTTQHFSGDIPQAARSCGPFVVVFQTTGAASLELLRKQYRLDEQTLLNLGVGEHYVIGPNMRVIESCTKSNQAPAPQTSIEQPPTPEVQGDSQA